MRKKRYVRNKPTKELNNIPVIPPKSTLTPPDGHPNLEVLLSQIENEVFKISNKPLVYFNLSKWETIISLL